MGAFALAGGGTLIVSARNRAASNNRVLFTVNLLVGMELHRDVGRRTVQRLKIDHPLSVRKL